MGEIRNVYKILFGKPERKRPLSGQSQAQGWYLDVTYGNMVERC
jgi:hypothetical protein